MLRFWHGPISTDGHCPRRGLKRALTPSAVRPVYLCQNTRQTQTCVTPNWAWQQPDTRPTDWAASSPRFPLSCNQSRSEIKCSIIHVHKYRTQFIGNGTNIFKSLPLHLHSASLSVYFSCANWSPHTPRLRGKYLHTSLKMHNFDNLPFPYDWCHSTYILWKHIIYL